MNRRRFVFIVIVSVIVVLTGFFISNNLEDIKLSDPVRATANGEFVETSAGKTHYLLEGDPNAPLIVMVHGITIPLYVWDQTAAALTAAGFQVLRLDLFGRGYSDRPVERYSREFLANQVVEVAQAVVPNKPYHLVGVSLGGAIAADVATRFPERVKQLALIAPFSLGFDISPIQYPLIGDYIVATVLVPGLQRGLRNHFFNPDENFPDWDEKYAFQLRLSGFRRAFASTLIEFCRYDQLDIYAELGQQNRGVLLVWGEEDYITPFYERNGIMQRVPQAKLFSVPKAGHLVHVEAAEQVNEQLVEFFGARVELVE